MKRSINRKLNVGITINRTINVNGITINTNVHKSTSTNRLYYIRVYYTVIELDIDKREHEH